MSDQPKYPNVNVELLGSNSNAFALMGKVLKELRRANVSKEERDKFSAEATAGDFDHLLQTCMKWVQVC